MCILCHLNKNRGRVEEIKRRKDGEGKKKKDGCIEK